MPEEYKKSTSPVWASVLGPQAQSEASIKELQNWGISSPARAQQGGAINTPQQVPNQQLQGSQQTQVASTQPVQKKTNDIQEIPEDQLVSMSALGGASEKFASAEIKRRESKAKKDEALWNYKPTQDFIQNIEEQARSSATATEVYDEFIKLAQSGEISPSKLQNFAASKFGEKLPFLYSPATAQAKLLEKLEAAGMKDIFPRPTEREFFFINSAQAQLGKTDAANVAVAQLNKRFAQIPIRAAEFTQDVIKENGGVPPRDLTAKVRKKMDDYRKDLLDESASISFEYGDKADRKKSAEFLHTKGKDLPLTDEKKREIFKMAGNDPKEALKLAIELGYKIPEE
jgi:hypothetical protein